MYRHTGFSSSLATLSIILKVYPHVIGDNRTGNGRKKGAVPVRDRSHGVLSSFYRPSDRQRTCRFHVQQSTQQHELARQRAFVCHKPVQIHAAGYGVTGVVAAIPAEAVVAGLLRSLAQDRHALPSQ